MTRWDRNDVFRRFQARCSWCHHARHSHYRSGDRYQRGICRRTSCRICPGFDPLPAVRLAGHPETIG